MSEKLTIGQQRFVNALIEGKSQRQAYIAAYPNAAKWKPENVDAKASNLFALDKVKTRYNALLDKATAPSIMTCVQLKEFFTKIVNDNMEKTTDRLKAAELLGKASALFIDKLDVSGNMQFNSGGLQETLEELRRE